MHRFMNRPDARSNHVIISKLLLVDPIDQFGKGIALLGRDPLDRYDIEVSKQPDKDL